MRRTIGLYGVSGAGKSHLLKALEEKRFEWRCEEGSSVIESILKGKQKSLQDFKKMPAEKKAEVRDAACQSIQSWKGMTVVAGHCSFVGMSKEGNLSFVDVFSNEDKATYDMIIYLDKDPTLITRQRTLDTKSGKRERSDLTAEHIREWTSHEKTLLRKECADHCIPFYVIGTSVGNNSAVEQVEQLIQSHIQDPWMNTVKAKSRKELDFIVEKDFDADYVLLIDGDKTLWAQDTGKLFFEELNPLEASRLPEDPLKSIHSRFDSYCFQAFFEVSLLYAKILSPEAYASLANKVGLHHVEPYPQWIEFVANLPPSVKVCVVTCSIRETWQAVIEEHFPTNNISLVSGNHVGLHAMVVDDHLKGELARKIRNTYHGCKVLSFGDSALDIPMMVESDQVFIAYHTGTRNRSLQDYIHQRVAAGSVENLYQLHHQQGDDNGAHVGVPLGSLSQLKEEILSGTLNKVINYSMKSSYARILATETRDASLNGLSLQAVHVKVGIYLAQRLIDDFPSLHLVTSNGNLPHVQGGTFVGDEACSNVAILPLMRGGEPMSRGVYETFPLATLIHIDDKDDAQLKSLHKSSNSNGSYAVMILVDSVINTGSSIRHVLQHLSKMQSTIVVVTGVIQRQAADRLPKEFPRVRFVALRVSENQYKGQGGTDTGNRLFGTHGTNGTVML